MARTRTLQLNGELVDHLEVLYKSGRTWNDVMAHICGYENFKDFCEIHGVYIDNKRCPYTEDMFEDEK